MQGNLPMLSAPRHQRYVTGLLDLACYDKTVVLPNTMVAVHKGQVAAVLQAIFCIRDNFAS